MKHFLHGFGIALAAFAFLSLTHAQSAKPDLIIDSITVSPKQPAVDQPAVITVTGRYEGSEPRISSKGFSSIDRKFTGFTFGSGSGGLTGPLPSQQYPMQPGTTFTYRYEGSFSAFGTHQLTFEIDYENELEELVENNNKSQTTVKIWGPFELPNLSMTDVALSPETLVAGEPSTITIRGVYTGADPLVSNQGLTAYSVTLEDFTQTNIAVPQPTAANPLASGSSFTYVVSGTFGSSGPKTLLFSVDTANHLFETSDTDNTITVIAGVTAPAPVDTEEPAEEPQDEEPTGEPPTQDEWTVRERSLLTTIDVSLTNRLRGSILLQVEEHGEAWYVRPEDGMKYYMKDGVVAYEMLRAFGLGITDADLAKIPVGLEERFADIDTDADGLPDKLEEGLKTDPVKADTDGDGETDRDEVLIRNTNPRGSGFLRYDTGLANRLRGRILLQVQSRGEAWYVRPEDGKRYYMKDGDAAYQIMRFLSLGITNNDLRKIDVGTFVPID